MIHVQGNLTTCVRVINAHNATVIVVFVYLIIVLYEQITYLFAHVPGWWAELTNMAHYQVENRPTIYWSYSISIAHINNKRHANIIFKNMMLKNHASLKR